MLISSPEAAWSANTRLAEASAVEPSAVRGPLAPERGLLVVPLWGRAHSWLCWWCPNSCPPSHHHHHVRSFAAFLQAPSEERRCLLDPRQQPRETVDAAPFAPTPHRCLRKMLHSYYYRLWSRPKIMGAEKRQSSLHAKLGDSAKETMNGKTQPPWFWLVFKCRYSQKSLPCLAFRFHIGTGIIMCGLEDVTEVRIVAGIS